MDVKNFLNNTDVISETVKDNLTQIGTKLALFNESLTAGQALDAAELEIVKSLIKDISTIGRSLQLVGVAATTALTLIEGTNKLLTVKKDENVSRASN